MPPYNYKEAYKEWKQSEQIIIYKSLHVRNYVGHNGETMYAIVSIFGIKSGDVAKIIGMTLTEYIFYLVKEFNGNYNRKLDFIYFATEEEANKALEWAEGMRLISKLEKAGM